VNDAAAWYALVADGKIGEQVERACNEHRPVGPRKLTSARERRRRVVERLDGRKPRSGTTSELAGRERTCIRGRRCDEPPTE
jgi:hypothetical protein